MKKARLFRLGESSKNTGLLKLLVSLLMCVCSLVLFAGVSFGATDGDNYENLRQGLLNPLGVGDYYGFSRLIREDNLEEIKNAIQIGADVNAEDFWGRTILMDAARFSSNPEVIATLIKSGADVNKRDITQLTALMLAAGENSNPEVIRALIQGGAEVNAENKNGETSLMLAVANNSNPEVIKILERAVSESSGTAPANRHRILDTVKTIFERRNELR